MENNPLGSPKHQETFGFDLHSSQNYPQDQPDHTNQQNGNMIHSNMSLNQDSPRSNNGNRRKIENQQEFNRPQQQHNSQINMYNNKPSPNNNQEFNQHHQFKVEESQCDNSIMDHKKDGIPFSVKRKSSSKYQSYDNLQGQQFQQMNQNNGNTKWPGIKQESSNSLCGMNNQNLQSIKSNVKNTYIKKINSLLNVQEGVQGQESSEEEKIKRVMSQDVLKIEQQQQQQPHIQNNSHLQQNYQNQDIQNQQQQSQQMMQQQHQQQQMQHIEQNQQMLKQEENIQSHNSLNNQQQQHNNQNSQHQQQRQMSNGNMMGNQKHQQDLMLEEEDQNDYQNQQDIQQQNTQHQQQQQQLKQQQPLNENNNNNTNMEDDYNTSDQHNGQQQNQTNNNNKKVALQSKPLMSDDKVKESAKNSRLRKKLYIELLEKKVTSLTDNIEKSFEDINRNRNEIGLIFSQNTYLSAFVNKRHEYFQNIQQTASADKVDEKQLVLLLDSYQYKMGTMGKTRLVAIDQFFQSLLGSFLQWNIQLFVFGNTQYVHSNEEQEFNSCVEFFQRATNLPQNDQRIYKAVAHIQKIFFTHRKNFQKLILRTKNIKKKLEKQSIKLEKIIQQIFNEMKPIQQAKLITKIDSYRKQPELFEDFEGIVQNGKRKYQKLENTSQTAYNSQNQPISYAQGPNQQYNNNNQQVKIDFDDKPSQYNDINLHNNQYSGPPNYSQMIKPPQAHQGQQQQHPHQQQWTYTPGGSHPPSQQYGHQIPPPYHSHQQQPPPQQAPPAYPAAPHPQHPPYHQYGNGQQHPSSAQYVPPPQQGQHSSHGQQPSSSQQPPQVQYQGQYPPNSSSQQPPHQQYQNPSTQHVQSQPPIASTQQTHTQVQPSGPQSQTHASHQGQFEFNGTQGNNFQQTQQGNYQYQYQNPNQPPQFSNNYNNGNSNQQAIQQPPQPQNQFRPYKSKGITQNNHVQQQPQVMGGYTEQNDQIPDQYNLFEASDNSDNGDVINKKIKL